MGPVDESGKDAAAAAAQPAKPATESATSKSATNASAQAEGGAARHDKLAEDRAPAIFTPAAHHRFSRAAVLAIAIALSAAAGSVVGAMAAVALAKPQSGFPDDGRTLEVNALRGVITQLSAEVASLKASIDGNARSANAQMARIADRVERAEKAQAEPASRVAKLSELLERIDRRTAPAAPASATDTTGSIVPKQEDRPAVLNGWVVREVFRGGAVVENERMGVFEVVPGANLPGLGRVDTIRRQDGRWVVVTPKGWIMSQR